MRLLVGATVTADGRPLAGPVDGYLPLQGPQFEDWLNQIDPVGARIAADRMFTFAAGG
jgi:hypothetical protein